MHLDLSKFLAILTAVGPVVLLAVPGGAALAPLVPLIVSGISRAQQDANATGANKKATVMQLVTTAIRGTNHVEPGTIDASIALSAASLGIDAVIGAVNAVLIAHAALPDVPAIVVPAAG